MEFLDGMTLKRSTKREHAKILDFGLGQKVLGADQCATAASRQNLNFIFESSETIFQTALETIEVPTHKAHFYRLNAFFK